MRDRSYNRSVYDRDSHINRNYNKRVSSRARARRHTFNRSIMIAMFLIVMFIAILFMRGFNRHSEAATVYDSDIVYTSVVVEQGDSLWSIAKDNYDVNIYSDFNKYVDDIKSINNILYDDIKAGQHLIIPVAG